MCEEGVLCVAVSVRALSQISVCRCLQELTGQEFTGLSLTLGVSPQFDDS